MVKLPDLRQLVIEACYRFNHSQRRICAALGLCRSSAMSVGVRINQSEIVCEPWLMSVIVLVIDAFIFYLNEKVF